MTVVLVLVLAGVTWYFLNDTSSGNSVLVSETAVPLPQETQRLVQSLSGLRSVELEGAIFQSPAFQALQDYSTPIVPEPVGRANPFLPISAGGTSVATTSVR